MSKVIRYQIADYLNTSETADTETYSLMGHGFNSLDENPAAKVDKTAYINDKSASGSVTGYENSFSFDTQFIDDEAAIQKIYKVARNQLTGTDAETDYVRVDLFGTETAGAFPARKFKVAIEVSSVTGAGTEIVKVAGNLHQIGDFVEGTFNTATKTFTEAGSGE